MTLSNTESVYERKTASPVLEIEVVKNTPYSGDFGAGFLLAGLRALSS